MRLPIEHIPMIYICRSNTLSSISYIRFIIKQRLNECNEDEEMEGTHWEILTLPVLDLKGNISL